MDSYVDVLLWAALLGLFGAVPLTIAGWWLWLRLTATPFLLAGLWLFYARSDDAPGSLHLTLALTALLLLGYLDGLAWKGLGSAGFTDRSPSE